MPARDSQLRCNFIDSASTKALGHDDRVSAICARLVSRKPPLTSAVFGARGNQSVDLFEGRRRARRWWALFLKKTPYNGVCTKLIGIVQVTK